MVTKETLVNMYKHISKAQFTRPQKSCWNSVLHDSTTLQDLAIHHGRNVFYFAICEGIGLI